MVLVTVKWGREKYEVDVDTNEPPLVFKSQLFALTEVAPDRQKVLIKGRTLGDDSWEGITLSPGLMLMMMGSTAPIPKAPTAEELAASAKSDADGNVVQQGPILPLGLRNLGNTCYFNSVLQVFQGVPELRNAIRLIGPDKSQLIFELRSTFDTINSDDFAKNNTFAVPSRALQAMHLLYPQFATFSNGSPEQQDSNECYTALLNNILTNSNVLQSNPQIKRYFEGRLAIKQRCVDTEEEPVQESTEDFTQISCYLNTEVKYIQTGIRNGLNEEVHKHSNVLGRDSAWRKEGRITRLPKYLSVQMVRFFYKGSTNTSAKILKDVKFPISLDMHDMCTSELQEKLIAGRDAIKNEEDAKIERNRRRRLLDKEEAKKWVDDGVALPSEFSDDPGSNNTGFYELKAVVSHRGRTVKSGHYVAWIRNKDDKWLLCDDENVSVVDSVDVLKTSGGGDWHTAYILLYEAREVKKYPHLEPLPEPTDAKN